MSQNIHKTIDDELSKLKESGLYKPEHILTTPQNAHVTVTNDTSRQVINMCANNYLGLANHPEILKVAQDSLVKHGYGMASVRFICGTQTPHKQLENTISEYLGKPDTILYSSCFAATTGLFPALLTEQDAIISDALNHACIIDGIKLSKAQRYIYSNSNMQELEACLQQAQAARYRMIATDGVFSMDGYLANLPDICELAQKYKAMVMVDDSHAIGVIGPKGKGTPFYYGLEDQVDIITGTLGKALGGSAGGFTTGSKQIIEWLRQKSRTYLFSNALPPVICDGSMKAIELIQQSDDVLKRLSDNTVYFRHELEALGFNILPGMHPIIPVMLEDAKLTSTFASQLYEEGIYAVGFSYPVVPMNEARIRVQISAAHTMEDLEKAVFAFACVGRRLGVL